MKRRLVISAMLLAMLVACTAKPTSTPVPTSAAATVPAATVVPTNSPPPSLTPTPELPVKPPATQVLPTLEAMPTAGRPPLRPVLPVTQTTDLPYTSHLLLDVYAPAMAGNWPVVVVLPFGGNKRSVSGLASAIAGQGAVVFGVEWRSSAPSSVAEIGKGAEDAACAVRFARIHGAEYGANEKRVVLVGHSAGGGIGALMMLAGDEFHGDCLTAQGSAVPDAFVGLDGTYDVISFLSEGVLTAAPADCARISPFTYLSREAIRPGSRFVLFVSDNRLLQQQAQAFRDALQAAGYDAFLAQIAGVDHLAIGSGSVPETVGAIADLMRATPTATSTRQGTTPLSTVALPLSAPGPYPVGWRSFLFRDAGRNNKLVAIALYYPAVATEGAVPGQATQDAAPNVSGAPYPVVLGAGKEATYFGIHLASYGMVFAGLEPQDNTPSFGPWLLDYPRDVIFALDQMAAGKLNGFAGILDPEHAGVLGYSFDSYSTLQMSGARMDPAYYQAQCAAAASGQAALPKSWMDAWGMCALVDTWDEFAALAGESVTRSDDGLWRPLADPRVRAVMPMGNDALILFGERGLAAIDRPTLVLESSEDEGYGIAARMFEYMPKQHAALITNVGKDHMILLDPAGLDHMRHFVTAFLGYHLLGRGEYAPYFSQEFVEQQDGLAWGVYEGE